MSDYNSMKVPELKKLLQSRSLGVTGNKADLVARLVENDKENAPADAAPAATAADSEDLINYSDDDEPSAPKTTAPKATESAPAAAVPAPAAAAPTPAAPATEQTPAAAATEQPAATAEPTTAEATGASAEPQAEVKDAAPKEDFSLHLGATDASDEARKRAERAKRFGITDEGGDDAEKKKAERAARFGLDAADISKTLDSALPERRPKRGRGEGEQGGRDNKRQTTGGGGGGRNGGRHRGGNRGGRAQGGRQQGGGGGGAPKKQAAPIDPAEKAKQEARAKRFAAA